MFRNNLDNLSGFVFLESEDRKISENMPLPIEVFDNDSLSALETVTKYLKEELNLRFKDIAIILNRNQKTVWDAYRNARNKMELKFKIKKNNGFSVPSYVFKDRSVSFLEALVEYLKDNLDLRYCQIASFLNRDDRTIWTVYHRVKIKRRGAIKDVLL